MGTDHYFTARPASQSERRQLHLTLGGRSVTVETAAGVFSGDRLDLGTSVLLDRVPAPPPAGVFLDLGCGWGPIALTMAILAPNANVWAIDSNERALELTRRNAARLGLANIQTCLPAAVPPELRFDLIWSNPPIRIGKAELHNLLGNWLGRLSDDGAAWLVVQRNLGADSLLEWLKTEFAPQQPQPQVTNRPALIAERAASAKGFRILNVRVNPHTADHSRN